MGFSSNGKCILNFFKENMSDTIYENILKDYMPESKRIGKMKFWYLWIIILYIKV